LTLSATLRLADAAERIALWHSEGAIKRRLPESFAPRYKDVIGESKQRLTSE
jgi:hypothetical protein